jgi:hypothetical protein
MARWIEPVPAPDSIWDEVRARLEAPPARPAGAGVLKTALVSAAALLVVGAAVAVWYDRFRERLEITAASSAPTVFETAARAAHLGRLAGALDFDYVATSPAQLRVWIRRHAGFDVDLAIARPPEDEGRFRVLGASIVQAGGARAALVGYEIDARPVTLLTAPLRDVPEAPPDALLKKKVAYRYDAERGVKLLTWGASGQAYVLVSDLPGLGTGACSICHTDLDRHRLILETRLNPVDSRHLWHPSH